MLVAARAVGIDGLPLCFDENLIDDKDFLVGIHRLLLDIHVIEGTLICPESGRRFAIKNGIPSFM